MIHPQAPLPECYLCISSVPILITLSISKDGIRKLLTRLQRTSVHQIQASLSRYSKATRLSRVNSTHEGKQAQVGNAAGPIEQMTNQSQLKSGGFEVYQHN